MANSIYESTGDGSTTDFTIPYSYLEADDVTAFVDGVSTSFTFTSDNIVSFTTAPANGSAVRIVRNTDLDALNTTYSDGGALTAKQLNDSNTQLLFGVQEAIDTANEALSLDNDGKFDAQVSGTNRVIKNVANPTNSQDVATKDYLENTWLTPADKTQLNSLNTANLDTVADDVANVNTVATNIADVNTVAARDADIDTVAARDADIGTVADRDADIGTVASRDTDIGTVAARDTEISRLGTAQAVADMQALGTTAIIADMDTLADVATDIATLADIEDGTTATDAISDVAAIDTNVTTVAGISANVTTVAGIDSDVTDVAGVSSDVTTVAGQISPTNNISTVAGIASNVSTVAGISSDVTTVAGVAADITTAATNIADITAVADEVNKVISVANDLAEATSEIDTVAASIANVDLVGADITNVNTVATNISDVNNFADTYYVSATEPSGTTLGDLWFDTTADVMKVKASGGFVNAGSSINGTSERQTYTAGTASGNYDGSSLTTFPVTYDAGFVDVYLNGIKMKIGTDVTATSGTDVVFASAVASGDIVDIVAFGTFELSNFSIGDANNVDLTGLANNQFLQYNSTTSNFEAATVTQATGNELENLSEDTSPSLGGNLDLNGSDITGTGDISFTGTLNASADVQINGTSVATTGKSIAMAIVFGG